MIIIAALTYTAVFGIEFTAGGKKFEVKGANKMRYGIDIRGGVEALYQAKDLDRAPTESELEAARAIIETRLDAKNINDREVTIDKDAGAILVRFPWKSDEAEFNPQKAIAELGETAKLTFRDPDGEVVLEGTDVDKSYKGYEASINQYVVHLELSAEGARKFSEATGRLIGQQISIYMDENLISAPRVETQITEGKAYINGLENEAEAGSLAQKISSGALPFSLVSSNHSTISPTLGAGALDIMVKAGLLAFLIICLFMIFYYKLPGAVASIALILQLAGQVLALSIPQFTLTLPGIAAIILSIGMGVDANIIISERIKEELGSGKSLSNAITTGYHRAFSAVFDGNVTTLLAAVVLMIFGSGTMISFGYSLLTGVLLNFLAGVTASRLMTRSLSTFKPLRNPILYGARRAQNV